MLDSCWNPANVFVWVASFIVYHQSKYWYEIEVDLSIQYGVVGFIKHFGPRGSWFESCPGPSSLWPFASQISSKLGAGCGGELSRQYFSCLLWT